MNIEQIKNTLREFQAENRQKFKNTQADFKKAVSYIKKEVYLPLFEYIHICKIQKKFGSNSFYSFCPPPFLFEFFIRFIFLNVFFIFF